ncbi:MAG: M20/M25/M40 family metallo-hydrolase [Defluviitaleaceae bacterium]|nr:M20/M25/M40 family metallo-hydrolase [Defluviitaleaceae bacterium]
MKILEDLTNAFGTPGFEDDVANIAKKYINAETEKDGVGNLYIKSKKYDENKPIIMIDAHMDEVSFMIKHVNKNGTLSYISLGSTIASSFTAQKMVIRNKDGELVKGVISTRPPHFSQKDVDLSHDSLVIDIGASSKEEAINNFKIGPGCPVVPDVFTEFDEKNDLVWAKALDCRVGCTALIEVVNELQNENLNVNISAVLTTQEEVGLRGIKVAARKIKPDIAIVFEGTPADDTFLDEYESQTRIKKGPMLRHIDAQMITNPKFQKFALEIGEKLGIPTQEAIRTGGSTNAGVLHLSHEGVPTIVIGTPVRYIHTPNTVACLSDLKNAIKLAKEVIKALDKDIIESFK